MAIFTIEDYRDTTPSRRDAVDDWLRQEGLMNEHIVEVFGPVNGLLQLKVHAYDAEGHRLYKDGRKAFAHREHKPRTLPPWLDWEAANA